MEAECVEIKEGMQNSLSQQLALALRSIQWSYAIFWSISSNNSGLLEWVDGYYNGDIKTRKTVQTAEFVADKIGLQRSEQLRELYESLLVGEANPKARRPSASLSPEDLTDMEWYYLVCMSFTFDIGQGLPGRTLSKNQTIWLCNAHQAESKTFSRSLLAKSASIQTVVCFPCLGGIIELGTSELVLEDLNIVRHVKTTFLEIPYSMITKITSIVSDNARHDQGSAIFDHDMPEMDQNPLVEAEDILICSLHNSSNGSGTNHVMPDPCIVEGINKEGSQVESWQFMDEEISDYIHDSVNCSDSISQSYATSQKNSLLSNGEKIQSDGLCGAQECKPQEKNSFNPPGESIYYQGVLSSLLKSSHELILGPNFRNTRRGSSFISWKKEAPSRFQAPRSGSSQRLLKKALCEVAKLHMGSLTAPSKDNGKSESIRQQEVNEGDKNSVFSERRQREKFNGRFMILRSMVPTNSKADKLTILDDTIEYLKELERRVQELESCKEIIPRTRAPHDAVERTSDNYGTPKRGITKKTKSRKRKVCDIDDPELVNDQRLLRDSSNDDVVVNVVDQDICIEMRFPWRDGVLLEIMEAIGNLRLESNTFQSTNNKGILSVTIKSKVKRSKAPSTGMIREALQRVIKKC